MTNYKSVTINIDQDLNGCFWWMNEIIEKLAKEREKAIEEKIKEFWITEENAKDYYIEIKLGKPFEVDNNMISKWGDKYFIYKKQYIWEFII